MINDNSPTAANCKKLFKVVQILSEAYRDVATTEQNLQQEIVAIKDRLKIVEYELSRGVGVEPTINSNEAGNDPEPKASAPILPKTCSYTEDKTRDGIERAGEH